MLDSLPLMDRCQPGLRFQGRYEILADFTSLLRCASSGVSEFSLLRRLKRPWIPARTHFQEFPDFFLGGNFWPKLSASREFCQDPDQIHGLFGFLAKIGQETTNLVRTGQNQPKWPIFGPFSGGSWPEVVP